MPRLGGKVRKKPQIEFDDDSQWACTVCTYQNMTGVYKCQICDAPRGSSTRKGGRIAEQIIQKQQQTQLYAQYGDGSTSTLEGGFKPRGGMEEVRRKSLVDSGHTNVTPSDDDDDESISERSSIASDTRPTSRLSNRRQPRRQSESEESVDVEFKSMKVGRKKRGEQQKKSRKRDPENSSEEETPKTKRQAKNKRRMKQSSSESENEPDSPSRSLSQPAKKRSKTPKRDEATPKPKNNPSKKVQQKLALVGKHADIDKQSGVDFTVSYGGTSFVVTEYKLKTKKPKPKSYPESETANNVKTEENGDPEPVENGTTEDKKTLEVPKQEPVVEIPATSSNSLEKPADKPEKSTTQSNDAQNMATIQKLSSKFHGKANKPPSLEEKFKNAFKNTDPKNATKKGNEMSKQLETTKEVQEQIQKTHNKPLPEKSSPEIPKDLPKEPPVEPKPLPANENSNNVPPASPVTPKKPSVLPQSSPKQPNVHRPSALQSPVRPQHPRYAFPSHQGPPVRPNFGPPRVANPIPPQIPSTAHPSVSVPPPKAQQPIRGIPLGKPIEIKKGGNRPPLPSPTANRPGPPQSQPRPMMGSGLRQCPPRPMRPSFPQGRSGPPPGSIRQPQRGTGPLRVDGKKGPRPVHPPQRLPGARPVRPHFNTGGPSGPSRPTQPRPDMVRAVHGVSQVKPSPGHNGSKPGGLKPIRGLPIGTAVTIKSQKVQVPPKGVPQGAPPKQEVKVDVPIGAEPLSTPQLESEVVAQASVQSPDKVELSTSNETQLAQQPPVVPPPNPLAEKSASTQPQLAHLQGTTHQATPLKPQQKHKSPQKQNHPHADENDSGSEDELQIDESVEPEVG